MYEMFIKAQETTQDTRLILLTALQGYFNASNLSCLTMNLVLAQVRRSHPQVSFILHQIGQTKNAQKLY